MPLPFSFFTQRQGSEAETPLGTPDISVAEKVMNLAPEHVSTEPLLGTPGNTFTPPVLGAAPRANPDYPQLPPAPSPNQRFTGSLGDVPSTEFQMATLHLPPTPMQPSVKATTPSGQEWAAQIEQLRNDVFGIAMSVSALNDRLDRLEQRTPPGGQSVQAGIATLRGEIETWLENHLNSAVEHCMQRVMSRTNSPVTHPTN
ncbi:hypothetical protein [Prosthecobacter sp.]|uniref:hypothetical protein n=1 Tax=Prosthecobacter sp. TaxID=1965333 RepID=UPI002AB9466E|nr:hypothetical protein [Prosthecobacter sp.]MDZ4403993.1 hypothetical protein [Prosthecobacter sp.]